VTSEAADGHKSQFYEVKSFITGEMLQGNQLLDEMDEIVIRVSYTKKYRTNVVSRIQMDSIRTRIHGQYGNPLFSDAVLTVQSFADNSILWTLPVHRAILSGRLVNICLLNIV